jgi:cation transport regulator ChaC
MTLHFAYGSNMSRPLMQRRCPGAQAIGTARLAGWRFLITPEGFGSIERRPGALVLGVVWRLTPRDLAALNAYESLDSGLYVRRVIPVRHGARRMPALTYVGPRGGEGTPRPGYIAIVVDAARDWKFPESYIRALARWSPSAWRGARSKDTGDLA